MASLTIHNLEELLRIRAAHYGHSMEEEVGQILRDAVLEDVESANNLAKAIAQRFAQLGGAKDLSISQRESIREPHK